MLWSYCLFVHLWSPPSPAVLVVGCSPRKAVVVTGCAQRNNCTQYWNLQFYRVLEILGESRFTLGGDFANYSSRPRVLGPNLAGNARFVENQNTGTWQSLCRVLKWGLGKKGTWQAGGCHVAETLPSTWRKHLERWNPMSETHRLYYLPSFLAGISTKDIIAEWPTRRSIAQASPMCLCLTRFLSLHSAKTWTTLSDMDTWLFRRVVFSAKLLYRVAYSAKMMSDFMFYLFLHLPWNKIYLNNNVLSTYNTTS